jgi:DNA-binding SARP family transcriptional activator
MSANTDATMIAGRVASAVTVHPVELHLLGGVRVRVDGRHVVLPNLVGRLLSLVALAAPYHVDRLRLAGELWPEHSESRAFANLRSALWRARVAAGDCLIVTGSAVGLESDVWVDIQHLDEVVAALNSEESSGGIPELLPGCYDDWVVHERERVRQLLLHALEDASRGRLDTCDFRSAINFALHAAVMEPLRETPHRLLALSLITEGNHAEAIRVYERYAALLGRELGISPTDEFRRLVDRH